MRSYKFKKIFKSPNQGQEDRMVHKSKNITCYEEIMHNILPLILTFT